MDTKRSLETMLIFVGALIIAYFVFDKTYLLYIALGFIIIGVFIPVLAKLLSKGWLKFGEFLGKIVSTILIGIIYYLILFPVSLLSGAKRKNKRLIKKQENSSYIDRNFVYNKDSIKNIW